jgi:superfamily II DNA or RNA helicase
MTALLGEKQVDASDAAVEELLKSLEIKPDVQTAITGVLPQNEISGILTEAIRPKPLNIRGRKPVYSNPELARRIKAANDEVNNVNKLCAKIKLDNGFRLKHGLDQESVDKIFAPLGVKAPEIYKIKTTTIKKALKAAGASPVVRFATISVTNPVLRKHQKYAVNEICKAIDTGISKGRVIYPTGTGKTRIEAEVIMEMIKRNPTSISVVIAPRILLTYQLLDRTAKIIASYGVKAEFLEISSGEFDSDRLERYLLKIGINPRKIETTTTIGNIKNKMVGANKDDKPLVIFSTYHSVDRVRAAAKDAGLEIDVYLFDEAQYCVTFGEFKGIPLYESKYKFFFTATEKYSDSDDGIGMNNEKKFGKILCSGNPKTLIEEGEMTSVAIHLVGAREDVKNDNHESKARVVIEAFDEHRKILKQRSARPECIGPKMLVVCDSQKALMGMMNSKCLKEYSKQGVKIYALSSEYGIYIEGYYKPKVSNKDKEDMFVRLQDVENTDEVIIFHVDMVAEGMDIPSITAVLAFRNSGKIKFLQNLGRGTRLLDIDRANLYNGTLKPKDFDNYVKPFCWLILPVVSSDAQDFKRRYTDYICALRSDYGMKTSEMVIVESEGGGPPKPPVTGPVTGGWKPKPKACKDIITEVFHAHEESETMTEFMEHVFEFEKLTPEEQVQLIKDIYQIP